MGCLTGSKLVSLCFYIALVMAIPAADADMVFRGFKLHLAYTLRYALRLLFLSSPLAWGKMPDRSPMR